MIAVTEVPPSLVVVGRGRLGRALAGAPAFGPGTLVALSGRDSAANPRLPLAELRKAGPGAVLLLAVRDDALPGLARLLGEAAAGTPPGSAVLHFSGALGPAVLDPLRDRGFATGCCHPLQTFPGTASDAGRFEGITFAVDGGAEGLAAAEFLAGRLGGRTVRVPARSRGVYHLAASLGANGLTGLVGAARDALDAAGFDPSDALAALSPLLRSALDEALRLGPEAALTGPASRGDEATLDRHRRALLAWDASRSALLEALLREQRRLAGGGATGAGC